MPNLSRANERRSMEAPPSILAVLLLGIAALNIASAATALLAA